MTDQATSERPVSSTLGTTDDLCHTVCALDEMRTLCGAPTAEGWCAVCESDSDEVCGYQCVVCEDLDWLPVCIVCGTACDEETDDVG